MRIAGGKGGRKKTGFSLVELLFTVGILGVFALLAAPIWKRSAEEARSRLCQGNLGQVGRAAALYAADHDDALPGSQHSQPSWIRALGEYTSTNVYRCPNEVALERRAFTIALNDFLTPRPYGARELNLTKRSMIPAPAETLMFAEADEAYRAYDHFHFADGKENGFGVEAFADQVDVERHDGAANYLYGDGQVREMRWSSEVKRKLTTAGARLVHPLGAAPLPVKGEMALAGRPQ